jgi:hypothetical protein
MFVQGSSLEPCICVSSQIRSPPRSLSPVGERKLDRQPDRELLEGHRYRHRYREDARNVEAAVWAWSGLSPLFKSVSLLVRKEMKSAQTSSLFLTSECRGNSPPIRGELAQVVLKKVSQPMTGQNQLSVDHWDRLLSVIAARYLRTFPGAHHVVWCRISR